MDYPADRLEIQVLDDSTDETVGRSWPSVVAQWREQGVDIVHVRRARPRRATRRARWPHGLALARGELIAIFDADFLPRPDFLRAAVPALVADPGLAFVQARWGHVNRGSSLLTRLQAVAIDGHFGIEQAGAVGAAATGSTSTARPGCGAVERWSRPAAGSTTR